METLPERKLPTFCPEVQYNEETEERTYICPVSGENVYTWTMEHTGYPDELLFINYLQADEPIYLKPELSHLLTTWYEDMDEERDDYDNFQDFLIRSLPRDEPFFLIVLDDPDYVAGETTYYLYRGVYTGDEKDYG